MKNRTVGVIGQGFVGGSLAQVFAERGVHVNVYDIAGKHAPGTVISPSLLTLVTCLCNAEKIPVFFVCLPTPMKEDGSCDLSILNGALGQLENALILQDCKSGIAVIKSTVPPGSTEDWNKRFDVNKRLHVVHNPEFLREATALEDMRNQDRIILGGPRPWINTVKQLYENMFPNVPIVKTSSTTSEMVKYVTNVHLAVKVSLANEFYQICEKLDELGLNIDYDKIIEYATMDSRLGKSHWKVPGPMPADDTGLPALGYGGSCMVKDVNALMFIAKQLGIDPKVMRGSWEKNLEVRPQQDWLKLTGRAVSKKE